MFCFANILAALVKRQTDEVPGGMKLSLKPATMNCPNTSEILIMLNNLGSKALDEMLEAYNDAREKIILSQVENDFSINKTVVDLFYTLEPDIAKESFQLGRLQWNNISIKDFCCSQFKIYTQTEDMKDKQAQQFYFTYIKRVLIDSGFQLLSSLYVDLDCSKLF